MKDNSAVTNGADASASKERTVGWLKLKRSDETRELLEEDPLAFALLALLASRARWRESFNIHGLELGEALAGDYTAAGMTRQQYRTRLHRLRKWGFVTIKPTNRGTVVKIISTAIFDICSSEINQPTNQRLTIRQPSANQRSTTNEDFKKEKQRKPEKQPSSPEAQGMNFDASVVEDIYQAYPKQIAKVAALKAISKALATLANRPQLPSPAGWLLERVRTFAASPAGCLGKYTPHPATWFNGGRYDDNPAEWQSNATSQSGSKATRVNLSRACR